MYATIRKYSPKTGAVTPKDITELKQRIESGFVPQIQEIRGFHAYHVVNVNNRELVTISLFEDHNGSAESTRRATEFVKKDPMKDRLGTPEVIEGELLISREAAVAAP